MDDKILYELAEDIILRDLESQSPESEYRSSISDERYQQLVGMIQQRDQLIQQQSLELVNVKKTLNILVQEHEHTIKIPKVRSVSCISLFCKVKDQYMSPDPKAKIKLNALVDLVNRVRPKEMKELDRSEVLEASRSLGFTWRKSDSEFPTDGWSIRKSTKPQMPVLPNVQSVHLQNPSVSPQATPNQGLSSPIGSPAPVMINRM